MDWTCKRYILQEAEYDSNVYLTNSIYFIFKYLYSGKAFVPENDNDTSQ